MVWITVQMHDEYHHHCLLSYNQEKVTELVVALSAHIVGGRCLYV